MWDVGADAHVLIKGGSATFQSYSSPAQYIAVGAPMAGGPPGIYLVDETGSGATVQSGVIGLFASSGGDAKLLVQIQAGELDILCKPGGSQFKMDAQGNFVFLGQTFQVPCGGGFFGVAAASTPATAIAMSPSPGTVSLHWFVSP
jgi:hypothetical protein